MKCFYHAADLDGHCSGAIVKHKYPECEMIGVDYDSSFNIRNIEKDEIIFIVDFSFNIDVMKALIEKADVHWIDHHVSAINKMQGILVAGIREVGTAGCELTWEYLYNKESMPYSVYLLGRYDVWDHEPPEVLPFQYGMRLVNNTLPEADIWKSVIPYDGIVQNIIQEGELILSYQEKQDALIAKGMCYEVSFEGYRALVINKPYSNSKVFDSVYDENKHDIMIIFGVKPGEIKYSLYCNKPHIDVSKIAVRYGGGGHRGAAGFYTKTLII